MATKYPKYVPVFNDRIIVDPDILAGKPVIMGTRIPVDLVLQRLAQDMDTKKLFEDYPRLTEEDVKACLAYAEELVASEEVYPAPKEKSFSVT